jgi:SAM-dependent methyltransferase
MRSMTNDTSNTPEAILQPDPDLLADAWQQMVVREKEQVERLREWQEQDYYRPVAQHFAQDPRRTGDEILDILRAHSRPDATWLDIGAGGGRYALPLALVSKKVIAIEPSEAMREVLQQQMAEHGIDNIEVLPLRWPEEADGLQVDFSLIAHVSYDIPAITPFLDALERSTSERCWALMMDRAPSSGFDGLWQEVHGEKRRNLPAMREFLTLLLARGATPEVHVIPSEMHDMDAQGVRDNARRRLWLQEGSKKDQLLQQRLDRILDAPDAIQSFRLARSIAVISWEPTRG